jgi:hypothetical protein
MKQLLILPILLAASTAFGQGKPGWLFIGNKSEIAAGKQADGMALVTSP